MSETCYTVRVDQHGKVWARVPDSGAYDTGRSVEGFVSMLANSPSGACIRADAHRNNIPLLMALYENQEGVSYSELLVRSPLAEEDAVKALFDVETVLGPSRGGWHPFQAPDYATYRLGRVAGVSEAYEALTHHPAARYFKLVPLLEPLHLCQVLFQILDPRFFIDPFKPDSSKKLQNYFGLTGNNPPTGGIRLERYLLLRDTWFDDEATAAAETDPSLFIWRAHRPVGDARGVCKASRRLLHYINYTWISCLTSANEPLFAPDLFFKRPDEVAWFKAVMGK